MISVNFKINGKEYPVVIDKKSTTKNLYIRVKEDLKIYVTCHLLTTDKAIQKILIENQKSIAQMISKQIKRKEEQTSFYFLGKRYDIVYMDQITFQLGAEKVFMSHDFPLDKWFKKQALSLFQEHLDDCYHHFTREIPYPSLRIRKMKTRWGVCNIKDKVITLNLELIHKDIKYLDYVIYHELSHLIYPNHSKDFWKLVEENDKGSKQIRKELNQ